MKKNCPCKKILIATIIIAAITAIIAVVLYSPTEAKEFTESRDQGEYLNAIELGGEWFLNNQNEDFLHYKYYPYEDRYDENSHALREMGALWSITQLEKFLNDKRYKELAQKGFAYFENYLEENSINDFYYINISPQKIKLGYNAFAILSLIEIDHPKKDDLLKGLANGILHLQKDNGELRTFFFSTRTTGKDYYPGEALLSLMALYEYNGDPQYLEAVQKAFPFYVGYFKMNPNTAFIPWQSRAYYKLFKATGDTEVRDFIFKMNDFILDEYNPKGNCSDFDFTPGIVAAVHSEGVNMAYDLAREMNDLERSKCYKNFSKETSDYILTLQITDEESFKPAAIGGFLGYPESDSQQVDRNQHAALSLIDAYNFGILK
ncbi:hypothetical protein ACFLZH_01210 [Patescibacteria group bacterium]